MNIEENIQYIQDTIPEEVTLIAVSKTRAIEEMSVAYHSGIRNFAENKVQEFLEKHDRFYSDVKWHIIGHLQTNKVKYIAGKVYLIHSLDSVKLAKEIEKQYEKINEKAQALIQVNIGKEESKTGIHEEDLEALINEVEGCAHIKVVGIMSIIPKGDESSNIICFEKVKGIFSKLCAKDYKNITMKYLSMGMSGDYKEAIEAGSNMIRIGDGIFGKRIYNNNL